MKTNNILKNKSIILDCINNILVDVITADYVELKKWSYEWKAFDYTPNYNKLYYICSGEGWIKIGGQELYPKQGQMVLMPAGIIQSNSYINENKYEKYWCHFTDAGGSLNFFSSVHFPYLIDVGMNERVLDCFRRLVHYHNNPSETSALMTRSCMLELLAFYIDNAQPEKMSLTNENSYEKLSAVISYINDNLSKKITLSDLAGIAHYHPNYFVDFFEKQMGISPKKYINKLKLDRCKELLIDNKYSIKEISAVMGFKNMTYFSNFFKLNTGFSPSEFIKIKNYNKFS